MKPRSLRLNPIRPLAKAASVAVMWMILTGVSGSLLLGGPLPRLGASIQVLSIIFSGLFFCFFIHQVFTTAPLAGRSWDGFLGLWEG
ncbi:hypothetical protein ACFL4N_02360 [Thermodesulfobacteriota bacterium]